MLGDQSMDKTLPTALGSMASKHQSPPFLLTVTGPTFQSHRASNAESVLTPCMTSSGDAYIYMRHQGIDGIQARLLYEV